MRFLHLRSGLAVWLSVTSITLVIIVFGHLAVACIEAARDEGLTMRARCIADLAVIALSLPPGGRARELVLGQQACTQGHFYQVSTPAGRKLFGTADGPPFARGWASQGLRHYDIMHRGKRYRVATALRLTPGASAPYFEVHVAERQPTHALAIIRAWLASGHVALAIVLLLAGLDLRYRSRGQFMLTRERRTLAHAAHELRTSLAVLSVQLQMGLRGDTGAERVLRDMGRTMRRALATSERVLEDAGARREAEYGPCRLDAVLEELALELAPLMTDKDIELTFRAAPAWVGGPEWRLWEIFSNLLTNAIRHAPPGGGIVLRSSPGPDGKVHVRIWNSGKPLDETRRADWFARFKSGPGGSGVGLGLALCAEHTRWLGGTIDLRNRSLVGHQGVEARVRLPQRAVALTTSLSVPLSERRFEG